MVLTIVIQAVLVIAFFEYVLYWRVVLGIAALLDAVWRWGIGLSKWQAHVKP